MGQRGPAPKPTKLKLVNGNPGKRPLNHCEPKPKVKSKVPPPPKWMEDEAKREWRAVAGYLHGQGLLSVVDESPLATYCQAVARWKESEQWIAEHGATYELRDDEGRVKYIQQVPQVAISRKSFETVKAMAREFGFTPAARSRIVAGDDGKERHDPLSEFLDGSA